MYSITFGTKNSYTDWNLAFDGDNSYISPAQAKRSSVNVPGADGSIDLTYALSSRLFFNDRTIHLEFVRFNVPSWNDFISEIQNYIQGRNLHVIKSGDPDYYWDAVLEISEIKTDERESRIVIEGTCKPYKLKVNETEITATGTETVNCTNSRMPVCPTIINSAEATIEFGSVQVTLSAGTHQVADIIFDEGSNVVEVTSTGTTKFKYREGSL